MTSMDSFASSENLQLLLTSAISSVESNTDLEGSLEIDETSSIRSSKSSTLQRRRIVKKTNKTLSTVRSATQTFISSLKGCIDMKQIDEKAIIKSAFSCLLSCKSGFLWDDDYAKYYSFAVAHSVLTISNHFYFILFGLVVHN